MAIDRGDIGVRIDRVLLRHLARDARVSRNRIQKLIESGGVLINGTPVTRVARRVAADDRVHVQRDPPKRRERPAAEAGALDILYEDDHLLVVNKPAGLVVHPSYGHATGTLINRLLAHTRARDAGAAPALVSRLDKHTSGVILVAKSRSVFVALQRAMHARRVDKDYLTLVAGKPAPARGTIDLALDRDPWDRRRITVTDRGGQPAVTRYTRLAVSDDGQFALVRCRLVTGRMHQIRVHLAARRWPIVGDTTYGGPAAGGAQRPALHAWRLALPHPVTGTGLEVTAPLPYDMTAVASSLGIDLAAAFMVSASRA